MRWDDLFDDLESQLEQELGAEEVDLLAEEERLRVGRLTLRDRIVAMVRPGDELRLALRDRTIVTIAVGSLGRDWMVGELRGPRRGSCLVPFTALASMLPTDDQLTRSLDGAPASESAVSLSGRLGLGFVLRDLCRRRAVVDLTLASAGADGGAVHGTIDRVGRDHFDVAEHEAGVPRRATEVIRTRMLPFSELLLARF